MVQMALEKLGVEKTDVVFVGDSIPSDMKCAEDAGIRGILVDRKELREYPEKIKTLKELKTVL